MEPKIQFLAEPKSALPLPPPKDSAPVTTLAATIGEISFSQYLANKPKNPSTRPPIKTAPIIAPYP